MYFYVKEHLEDTYRQTTVTGRILTVVCELLLLWECIAKMESVIFPKKNRQILRKYD